MSAQDESFIALLYPASVRARCAQVTARLRAGASAHWTIEEAGLERALDAVRQTIARAYPRPEAIPEHERAAHFAAGGIDRLGALREALAPEQAGSALVDLVIVSVLLDAGAGAAWRFREGSGTWGRSEGLAIATLSMARQGAFARDGRAWGIDASQLAAVDERALARGFQVNQRNPLVGLTERAALLARFGRRLASLECARPIDLVARSQRDDRYGASRLLFDLNVALGPIWPPRLELEGVELGDASRHDGFGLIVPFHKLMSWLVYSLSGPLAAGGTPLTGLAALPPLAEYRNGGLLVDAGALRWREPAASTRAHAPDSDLVVEWRAATVTLIDELCRRAVEEGLIPSGDRALSRFLQGGSWQAGRDLAAKSRVGGAPPVRVERDGTLF